MNRYCSYGYSLDCSRGCSIWIVHELLDLVENVSIESDSNAPLYLYTSFSFDLLQFLHLRQLVLQEAFNFPRMSSKLVVLRSITCSRDATMCTNFFKGKLIRNFFTSLASSLFFFLIKTSLASSMATPRAFDLEAISDRFPPNSSILSDSFSFRRSN